MSVAAFFIGTPLWAALLYVALAVVAPFKRSDIQRVPDDQRVPDRHLPPGVGPAWFDTKMLRLAAEAHNRTLGHPPVEVKPWVLLSLLDGFQEWSGAAESQTGAAREKREPEDA